MKNRKWLYIVHMITLIFYFWLAAQIPYTHDDWEWGIDVGIHQFVTANINSRYVGNFFEVIMTRSEPMKILIMGIVFFAIPYFISIFVTENRKEDCKNDEQLVCFLVSNLLLLTIDRDMWRQTCGWIAGFANYVISAVFMLLCVMEGLRIFNLKRSDEKVSVGKCVFLFCISLLGQLFLENLAIYMMIFSLFIYGYSCLCSRKVFSQYLAMTAGTLLGLIIMFSSSVYSTLLSTGEAINGYRKLSFGSNILESIYSCIKQVIRLSHRIYEDNLVLCLCILSIMSILLIYRGVLEKKWYLWSCVVTNVTLFIYFVLNYMFHISPRELFSFVINCIFGGVIALEIILLFGRDKVKRYKMLAIWCSTFLTILPLVVTTVTAARLFYTSNIFMIVFSVMLLCEILELMSKNNVQKVVRFSVTVLLIFLLFYGNIYSLIGECKVKREKIISTAIENGEDIIILPRFPYEEYLWGQDPGDEYRWNTFKAFYEIPNNVRVNIE